MTTIRLARCFAVKNPTTGNIVDVGRTAKEARTNARESSILGNRAAKMPVVRMVEVRPKKVRPKKGRRRA